MTLHGDQDYLLMGVVDINQSTLIGRSIHGKENDPFLFNAIQQRSRASTWHKHLTLDDGMFCQAKNVDGSQRLLVAGNVRESAKESSTGFSIFNLDVIDLDEPIPEKQDQDLKLVRKQTLFQKQKELTEQNTNIHMLEFVMPNFFHQIQDDSGNLKLPPHTLLPLSIKVKVKENKVQIQNNNFHGQLFFRDPLTKKIQLVFIAGSDEKVQDLTLPKWPSSQSEDVFIQYPILAYKTQIATNNEICLVNLVKNEPQKVINFEPYRFVQFIDVGLNPERFLCPNEAEKNVNTCVFFIVQYQGIFRIMYYKVFPYELVKIQTPGFQTDDCINILSGSLQFKTLSKSGIAPQRFTNEKIIAACFLQRPQLEGVKIMVVIQLFDGLFYFSLNNEGCLGELSNTQQTSMIKLVMQRGPYEEIYYGERSKHTGDKIVCIQYKSKDKLQKTTVKKINNAKLLALQMLPQDNFDEDNYRQHSMLIMDSQCNYQQLDFIDSDSEPTKQLEHNLKSNVKIDAVMEYLQINPWARITGNNRGFTVLLDENRQTVAATLSLKSPLVSSQKIYEFNHDIKFQKHKVHASIKVDDTRHVNSVKGVPWMEKTIYEIKDTRFDYFMLTGSKFSNKVQLLMPDQLKRLQGTKEIIFIGNVFIGVPVQEAQKYLLFSQQDYRYVDTINYKNLKRCGTIIKGTQFFFGNESYKTHTTQRFIMFKESPQVSIKSLFDVVELQQSFITLVQGAVGSKGIIKPVDVYKSVYSLQSKLIYIVNLRGFTMKVGKDIILQQGKQIKEITSNQKEFIDSFGSNMEIFDDDERHSITGLKIPVNIYKLEQSNAQHFNKYASCFAIQSPILESAKSENIEFLFTDNYIIIIIEFQILYHSLVSTQFKDHSKGGDLKKRMSLKEDTKPLDFTLINIKEFFNQQYTNNGMKVRIVTPQDMDIIDKTECRTDLIQISFANLAIVWDLNENKEVTFIEKQAQFSTSDSFVSCGLTPHTHIFNKDMKNSRFLSSNEDASLIIQPAPETASSSTLFRQFCELDLLDIYFIMKCEQDDIHVKQIDLATVLANFEGLTFFEIFSENPDHLDLIFNQIAEAELKDKQQIDASGNESDNIFIRRMFRTMLLPIINQKHDPKMVKILEKLSQKSGYRFKNLKNILQEKLFDQEGQYMLEPLLTLLKLSDEFKLSNLVASFEGFKKVFATKSSNISEFMEHSLFSNEQTVDVQSLRWNRKDTMISFGQQTSQLSPAKIMQEVLAVQMKRAPFTKKLKAFIASSFRYITKGYDKEEKDQEDERILLSMNQMIPVKVEILEIEWLSESMKDLYVYMSKLEDNSLFGNNFIRMLLMQQDYTLQVFMKVFLPYIFYFVLSLHYMTAYVALTDCNSFTCEDSNGQWTGLWLRILILVFAGLFMFIEFMQIYVLQLNYFDDFWNYLYVASILTNVFIVLEHSVHFAELTYDQLCGLNSVGVVVQWAMMYYWMRLFPSLAFFVTFLTEVIKDIGPFSLMFFICIFMFGNAVYVLQQSQNDVRHIHDTEIDHMEEPLIQSAFKRPYIDALLNQYQIAIGMAELDSYGDEQPLVWIFYLCTTLWTQLTFFNMLIGIMGQTFERVVEGRDRNSLMERTKMYADFLWVIRLSKELKGKRYMYIVRPIEDDSGEQIEGSISGVNHSIQKLEKKLQMQLKTQANKICSEVADFQIQSLTTLNEKVNTVQDEVKHFSSEVDKLNQKMDLLLNHMLPK